MAKKKRVSVLKVTFNKYSEKTKVEPLKVKEDTPIRKIKRVIE